MTSSGEGARALVRLRNLLLPPTRRKKPYVETVFLPVLALLAFNLAIGEWTGAAILSVTASIGLATLVRARRG